MLELREVSSGYGKMGVLHGISLSVSQGEMVSVIGVNGAGKSTLLRTISLVIPCSSGEIAFEGQDITRLSPDKVVKLGIVQVPEGRQIFGPMTVYENLLLGTYSKRREFGKKKLNELLDFVFELFPMIADRRQQRAGTLSGGEQQALALGRALMGEPKLLILDEPSLGLAPKVVEAIGEVLVTLNKQGMTVLLVEQNAYIALTITSRAYVMDDGHIAIEGPSQELLHNEMVRRVYLGIGL